MARGTQSSAHTKDQRIELFLDLPSSKPLFFDITDFIKSHPGGNIIRFYHDQDATDAFLQFHSRSMPRVERILQSLPSREPTPEELFRYRGNSHRLVSHFRQFTLELQKEGYFDYSPLHVAYRLSELVIGTAIGFLLCWAGYFWIGCSVLGIFLGRYGWLMHENGHFSLTTNVTIDKWLQRLLFGVGNGCSAAFWSNQHNKHHAMPQRVGHDVDLNTLPLVAFNDEIAQKGNPAWLKYQHILYFALLEVVALLWTFFLHPRHSIRTGNYVELPFMLVNHGLRLWAGYLYDGSISSMIISYFFIQAVLSTYIFGNFALSHTHMPVLKKSDTTDWVHYAANHTCNIHNHPITNWWMSYLNFQIEHHLWPSMPQYRIPEIQHRVKQFFDEHGIVYNCIGYFDACKRTAANLRDVGSRRFSSKKKKQ